MNFIPYTPQDQDRQESPIPFTETNGCMSFACVHNLEIQEKVFYGNEVDYSEQIVCVGSGTSSQTGNSLANVFNWIKAHGLVRTSVSPEPVDFTLKQFYTIPSPILVASGALWLVQWDVSTSLVAGNGGYPLTSAQKQVVFNSLTETPTLITIDLNVDSAGTPTSNDHQFHEVVLLNTNGDYFDSYSTLIKNLNQCKIYYANKLIIKPKTMSNVEFVQKAGTQEFGFYFPALSEDALKDKALNVGLNILNPDNTINFTTAKVVSGL